jgi:hypothetical protein
MIAPRTLSQIDGLRKLPADAGWIEFEENSADPQMVGKLIAVIAKVARIIKSLDWVLIRDKVLPSAHDFSPYVARRFANAPGREFLDRVLIGRSSGRFEGVPHG